MCWPGLIPSALLGGRVFSLHAVEHQRLYRAVPGLLWIVHCAERCPMLVLLGFVIVVLDIIALVTIVRSAMSVSGKLLWALIVLLLPVVGMLVYFAVGHKA